MTSTGEVVDEVPVDPTTGRIYAEGWQSWSPATWYAVDAAGQRPEGDWQHLMRFRPGTPVAATGVQGEGLLVVDPGNGAPARRYCSMDPVAVPTIHATHEGGHVVVRASGPVRVDSEADGGAAALESFGEAYAASRGLGPLEAPPTVWCSWYRYFEEVTAADVEENLLAFADHELSVDVVQIDDGWSPGLGEGLVVSDRFGSLPSLIDRIRGSGRRAGIWLAPFLVGTQTTLAREHPDWLVGPAGYNWEQDLAGLDLTHPGVRDLLHDSLRKLVDLGVEYFKLDFLYGGAVPGRRREDCDPVAAYRTGLELVREAVGSDAYLVGCGAPILPSVGFFDAMRVSPDTFHLGGEDGSTGLRGLMPLAARSWQQGRWWVADPDCVVARPSYSQRERWFTAASSFGGLRSFSDRVGELDQWGAQAVASLLSDRGTAAPFSRETVRAGAELAFAEGAA